MDIICQAEFIDVSLSYLAEFKIQTSSVRFSDVGGCAATLHEINRILIHLHHPEVFSWLGVRPPRGFLLHGPPGCGKTLLAHAIAGVSSLKFYYNIYLRLVYFYLYILLAFNNSPSPNSERESS